ncbi:Octanoyltransferase LipM [Polystyrenella longa]|uniref:Octanoyltransferase LipM n=1 Tax=Polystyrenella longa TaxID=2528007 RepID=A0A518CM51_9PLAN|nr:lipoate--protein ligase [Polystyrenella longa]QDU80307.1 Octanoyltransferase LipM [Polystyrenella longa]
MSSCQLLLDLAPHSGVWNMAMDEALLDRADRDGISTVRLYRWELPTVSLGYFQKNEVHVSLEHLPRVRRLTGGGAILHHHEITYSCTLPASHELADQSELLYEIIHIAFIGYLAANHIQLEMRGQTVHAEGGFHAEPFLCFGRQDARDLVLENQKVLGSAQRRRRGAMLQHGSLVMRRSPFAPEFAGIRDLHPDILLPDNHSLMEDLGPALANALHSKSELVQVDGGLMQEVEKWSTEKYLHLDWKRK